MTTTTPRRALSDGVTRIIDAMEGRLMGVDRDTILPRRALRPQRALHCLETRLCFGCPDDEHRRSGPAFEEQPRRAVSLTDWAVPERWAS